MSGIDEILPWALENFPIKNYSSKEKWYEAVEQEFEDDGRLPLDKILKDEKEIFLDAFTDLPEDSNQTEIQEFVDDAIIEQIEEPEPPTIKAKIKSEFENIETLRDQGISLKQIALDLGVNYNTLRGRLSDIRRNIGKLDEN